MTAKSDPRRPYYQVDPNMDRYIFKHMPASERWWNLGVSLLNLGWGSFDHWANDLIVPTQTLDRHCERNLFHAPAHQ